MKKIMITMVGMLMALTAHSQGVLQVEMEAGSTQYIYAQGATVSFWGLPDGDELNRDLKVEEMEVYGITNAHIDMQVNICSQFDYVGIRIATEKLGDALELNPETTYKDVNERSYNSSDYEISYSYLNDCYRLLCQTTYSDYIYIQLHDLDPGRTYYVTPFAYDGKTMYQGSEKSFTTPWTLATVLANYYPWYKATEIPGDINEFIIPTDKAWENFCNKYKTYFGDDPSDAVMQALTTAWFYHLTPAEANLMKDSAVAHYDNCVDGDVYIVENVCDELIYDIIQTTGDIDLTRPNLESDDNGRTLYTNTCRLLTEEDLSFVVECDASYGIEGNQYVKIEPSTSSANPAVGYNFPFLLLPNHIYDVTITIAPNTEDAEDERPNKFYVNVFNSEQTKGTRIANPVTSTAEATDYYFIYGGQKLETFTIQIDTHDETFASPKLIQLYSQIRSTQRKDYSSTIRIAKINVSLAKDDVIGLPIAWQMNDGWNWVSHNLAGNLNPVDVFGENVVEVKSQTKGLIRDTKFGVVGNLTELVATEAYKVKVTKADTKPYLLTGNLFDVEANAINLKEGWNWIGYPMATEATVEDALKNFAPAEGDIIVGQDYFSTYNGDTWIGGLVVFTPGRGYMYKSGAAEKSVHFNSKAEAKVRVEAKARTESEVSLWTCNIYKYPNIMPATIKLYNDGVEEDVTNYDIAAFCGDECRGVGKVVKGVVMMNVCGEGNETITFKALDRSTGIVMDIVESVPFTSDVLGAYTEPFKLNLGEEESTGIKLVDSSQLTVDDDAIYNVAGQRMTMDKKALPKGVYIRNGKRILVK